MDEEIQQTDERQMTPTNGAVSPPINPVEEKTPEVAAAPAAPPPVTAPARDWESELATKDHELKSLESKMADIQGASKASQEERQKLMVEVARLVNEREAIERAKDEALTQKTQELEQVSQATQTLTQKTANLEQQLAEATARATKLEVISQEFPHLLRYSQFIPASADAAEIRGYCQMFQQTRESDLAEYGRIVAGGQAVRTVPTTTPATRVDVPGDTSQLEQRLEQAMNTGNRDLFERELQAAIQNYEARRPR